MPSRQRKMNSQLDLARDSPSMGFLKLRKPMVRGRRRQREACAMSLMSTWAPKPKGRGSYTTRTMIRTLGVAGHAAGKDPPDPAFAALATGAPRRTEPRRFCPTRGATKVSLLSVFVVVVSLATSVFAPETSCTIDGELAPVCPGTAPRAANGCCWRNGKSEDIENWDGGADTQVVDAGASTDAGEELRQLVCKLDEAGCQAADSGDWGEDYQSGDSTAVDTVRFCIKLKEAAEDISAAAADSERGSSRGSSDAMTKSISEALVDAGKDVALAYVCDRAKVECEEDSGWFSGWFWPVICLVALLAVAGVFSGNKSEGSSG